MFPTQKKIDRLLEKTVSMLKASQTSPRELMSLIGSMASMEKTIPLGRLHMRPLQWYLKTHWRYPQSLDRTSDLRENKELVFVSFQKGSPPANISSWIEQTVMLCYEVPDQQALTLYQVKAHDVRAFAASKDFQSRISLEQKSASLPLEVTQHLHTVLVEGFGLG